MEERKAADCKFRIWSDESRFEVSVGDNIELFETRR